MSDHQLNLTDEERQLVLNHRTARAIQAAYNADYKIAKRIIAARLKDADEDTSFSGLCSKHELVERHVLLAVQEALRAVHRALRDNLPKGEAR